MTGTSDTVRPANDGAQSLFAVMTFEEKEKLMHLATDWLASEGIPYYQTRIGKYQKDLRRLNDARESDKVQGLTMTNSQRLPTRCLRLQRLYPSIWVFMPSFLSFPCTVFAILSREQNSRLTNNLRRFPVIALAMNPLPKLDSITKAKKQALS